MCFLIFHNFIRLPNKAKSLESIGIQGFSTGPRLEVTAPWSPVFKRRNSSKTSKFFKEVRRFVDYIILKFRFFCIFRVDSIAFHHRLLLNLIGFKLSSVSPNFPSLSRHELFAVRNQVPPTFIISIRVRPFSAVG